MAAVIMQINFQINTSDGKIEIITKFYWFIK